LRFGPLLRTSGLRDLIPCVRRRKTSSGRCVWSTRNSDTTSSVSCSTSTIPVRNRLTQYFSPCPGRETQARKAGQDAPFNPHTRQLSEARSWYLNQKFGVSLSLLEYGVSLFRSSGLSPYLYNRCTFPLLFVGDYHISRGKIASLSHRCNIRQKFCMLVVREMRR
jgi:hypothetical protein